MIGVIERAGESWGLRLLGVGADVTYSGGDKYGAVHVAPAESRGRVQGRQEPDLLDSVELNAHQGVDVCSQRHSVQNDFWHAATSPRAKPRRPKSLDRLVAVGYVKAVEFLERDHIPRATLPAALNATARTCRLAQHRGEHDPHNHTSTQ